MKKKITAAHVTHEAIGKIGGIGAVLEGLFTSPSYLDEVDRSILISPLFSMEGDLSNRLGSGGEVLYSSLDGYNNTSYYSSFRHIEDTFNVNIVYGRRTFTDHRHGHNSSPEVILIDISRIEEEPVNNLKAGMFAEFGIESHKYENLWEFEQYVRLAPPALAILKAIGAVDHNDSTIIVSHEFMGMPTALAAKLDHEYDFKTVFYAHEVAPMRPLVEKSPGHDTMFYNVMEHADKQGKTLEEIFPQCRSNFKHSLVKAAKYCDHVFCVGDYIVKELHFLDDHFYRMGIDLVYNGIPAEPITLEEKHTSRNILKQYSKNLLGTEPTWTFTHVARPVLSKGLWRDLLILDKMEPLLQKRGETVVYFMLGTLGGQRRGQIVRNMERNYGWPVEHELGYPDLCGGEELVAETFEIFNQTHTASRAILVNQWGFNHSACGDRMPAETTISHLRRGCDLEFGLSVYEPFGISQFEPLSFGALCVVSNVCGCMGFANAADPDGKFDNIIEGNFLHVKPSLEIDDLLNLTIPDRDSVEGLEAGRLAKKIVARLPRDDKAMEKRIADGLELSRRMSWEHVVQNYFMPSLGKVVTE
ncbi:MAG: hypothetical protein KAR11_01385 [Phycisphaerae bacterium]|nr:hypothetical protein [Phycisphaerae bacterium]